MLFIDLDDYPQDSHIRVLTCEGDKVLATEAVCDDQATVLFLEHLGRSPRPVVVARYAKTLSTSSAVYVGDGTRGTWFVGLRVRHLLIYTEMHRQLWEKLEFRMCDDEGVPILDDSRFTPFANLARMLYNKDGQLLTGEQARELEAEHSVHFPRLIQFYLWMNLAFTMRRDRRPQEIPSYVPRWFTFDEALKYALLRGGGWQVRSRHIDRTTVRVWES